MCFIWQMTQVVEWLLTVDSILCSDFAIKRIDEPFITKDDHPEEWAL